MSGSELGGTKITVFWSGKVKTDQQIFCVFDESARVPGKFVAAGELECVTPTYRPGVVRFSLLQNEEELNFLQTRILFTLLSWQQSSQ